MVLTRASAFKRERPLERINLRTQEPVTIRWHVARRTAVESWFVLLMARDEGGPLLVRTDQGISPLCF